MRASRPRKRRICVTRAGEPPIREGDRVDVRTPQGVITNARCEGLTASGSVMVGWRYAFGWHREAALPNDVHHAAQLGLFDDAGGVR